ncbi:MAG: hypothetical protein ACI8VC_002718 [Candidatus Endobugula sp.]
MVYAGNNTDPSRAFSAAVAGLNLAGMKLLGGYSFKVMDDALDELNQLRPLEKPTLLRAIIASINADQQVTIKEAELFVPSLTRFTALHPLFMPLFRRYFAP